MNDLISNKRTGYLLIIALAAVVFGAIYYFLIYPLNEEKNSKETSITTVENEIALLDAQSVVPVEEAGNSMFLEKKVPLTRELDKLLQSVEEVELVSQAKIESIDFNNYDEIVADSSLVSTEETATETEGVAVEDGEGEQAAETPVSPVANTPLPSQLKLITFNISVLTKDYNHFNTFIKELESIERINRIDQVEFSMPGEEQGYDEEFEEAISARIQVTTFYYDE
ncbi:potassium transporter [Psychrobacillus sp. FSL H8-0487]|uniref:potassium transporter n=1 Tax=Psychrobacillus sp. FSL H8-0487 TaxID=2921391 RepID=UPI0030F9DFCC